MKALVHKEIVMKQTHFVQTASIQTHLHIRHFLICVWTGIGLLLVTIAYIDVPILWHIYKKRSYCMAKKELYTIHQQLVQEKKATQIVQNPQHKKITQLKKKIDALIFFALNSPANLVITYYKQDKGKVVLQGYGKEIGSITDVLRVAQEQVGYKINISSVEKNEQKGYMFHAVCIKKQTSKINIRSKNT
jgi:hypothetical protein